MVDQSRRGSGLRFAGLKAIQSDKFDNPAAAGQGQQPSGGIARIGF
jgi:hypothetical protein